MKRKFKSILLIDDNVAENRYNQIILEEMNVVDKIEIAASGEQALQILENTDQSQPKLILLDINMPKMNGWEFLEAYKKLGTDDKNEQIVVILTTSMNPEDKQKAGELPYVSEFNIKPLTPEMLNNILQKYSSGDNEE